MTPERIAEIRLMPHDNWRIIHELLDALAAANSELSRLRSSPAPVVGGVPEPTMFDINREYFEHFANVYTTPKEREAHKAGFITGAAWHREAASRLPALKPGEVEIPEPTGIVVDLPARYREKGVDLVREAIQWARHNARIVPSAQATTTEKEN